MRGTVLTLLCAIYIAHGREVLNKNGKLVCTCSPEEANNICAVWDSDDILIAHEKCNKFYKCAYGKPVSFCCSPGLLYNSDTQICDWPYKVECGERVIAYEECQAGGDGGGNDNGPPAGNGTCNCNPAEAPSICAADGSEGTLVAHEYCNYFYQCSAGRPVSLRCAANLLYNPYTEQCDWPENVDCGDREIREEDDNNNGGDDSDAGGGGGGGADNKPCNCNPEDAPSICAADGSDGVLVAHEDCNKFYKCDHGRPVAMNCSVGLLYNPYIEQCDWPKNVDCGDRNIPECDNGDTGDDGHCICVDDEDKDISSEDDADDGLGGENGDNGNGCNCNPEEAPKICAADDSDGVLVAHEECNKFYKCTHGLPVAITCYTGLLYNPYTEKCDWPKNVDCGDRTIPECEDGDSGDDGHCNCNEDNDNGGGNEDNDVDEDAGDSGNGEDCGDNEAGGGGDGDGGDGGTCNCNPGEAPAICEKDGSDGTLIAHEKCNKYYICNHGKPAARPCPGNLFFNPYTNRCDWPENVDCGDRVIPDAEDNDSGGVGGGGDGDQGGDNGAGDDGGDSGAGGGGGGGGTCNCNPGEAPAICAQDGSNGVLVAHENCNQFYKCAYGVPVAMTCYGNLLYNPHTEKCDWPENVDCGDRVIPDGEDNGSGGDGGGSDGGQGGDNGAGEDGGDSGAGGGGGGGGTCNCNPGEAPAICEQDGSDGTLIAHEKCNKYYICNHGKPVARPCPGNLFFNPYTNRCDWPENVDCGDRVIPDAEDNDSGSVGGGGDGDQGGDNGAGEDGGDSGAGGGGGGGGTCNCNPGEAPAICAQDGSNGVLVAHENCNQFYKCAYGIPVAMTCYGNLLYNPHTEKCDWPENVDCGDRVIPDGEDNGSGGDGGGSDGGQGGDNGAGEDGGDSGAGGGGGGGGTCNCNPGEAPAICEQDGSDGTLIAHEKCNKYYICNHGKPVARPCPGNLFFNPYTNRCDWPENVDCGDRVIPDAEDNDSGGVGGGGDGDQGGDNGAGDDGGDSGAGGGGGGGGTCNCNPGEAPAICAQDGSNGVLVAHENCNQFYKCAYGVPVAMTCYGNLLYNPHTEKCDWPENVDCGDRVIPDGEDNGSGGDGGGSDGGQGGDNGAGEDGGDSGAGGGGGGGGTCNCNPGEAPAICEQDGSDGTLIAHEKCNKYYICNHGKPVARPCPGNLFFNPYTNRCDWPENVDCGDRLIPDAEDNDSGSVGGGGDGDQGGDNGAGEDGGDSGAGGGGGGGGTCNCNPGEAPAICAQDGSNGVLVAHENCNQFYKCAYGIPVAMTCYGNLLYNPHTEKCDWPENVDCGDRVIPDGEDNGSGGDGGGSDGGQGGDNGAGEDGGDSGAGGGGGGGGTCNCNPGEAPAICEQDGSDGTLIAHEKCNKYYICNHGKPVARPCPGNLFFNPYTNRCDWPENVDCGDRVIPDAEDNDSGGVGGDGGQGGDNGAGEDGGDSGAGGGGGGGGTCNCNPGEAPAICAQDGSNGVLVAHENCNQFYKCAYGVPVAMTCYGNLLYNPHTEQCDWPENVDCGDRVIPDGEDNGGGGGGDGDQGGDNGAGEDGGDSGAGGGGGGGGTCNCNPGEAPAICAQDGSNGVLVAHENCNQFYKCAYGVPVAMTCYGNLLYNPYTEQCDWPENVDCGDRVIPDGEDNGSGGGGGGGGDGGQGGDNGAGEDGGDSGAGGGGGGGGTCNCNPGEAPAICAQDGSNGVLVAHENCNQFYKCAYGVPVAMTCYGNLLYNPHTEQCDWPENVDCGDRVIPDGEDNGSGGGGGGGDGGQGGDNGAGEDGGDSGAGGGGGGGGTCNCNPGEAPAICAQDGSNGVLVAHENCNQFYKCAYEVPVALTCYGNLLYNPHTEQCDWPENVDCGDRVIPDCEDSGNGGNDGDQGGDNGTGEDGGDSGAGGGGGGGTCNCNPGEAPAICAQDGSNEVFVAHENCNQFYKCAHGVPVAMTCYGNLLYNPHKKVCDWPENVDCGDRVIPDCEDSGNGGSDGDQGGDGEDGGDSGAGGGGGGGTCNCNPGEAPAICEQDGSDGTLIAHEHCNRFYQCANGNPVTRVCPAGLLYNPYKELCDWPGNVKCGNRTIPEDNGGNDNGQGGGDNEGENNISGGNDDPSQAPTICASQDSENVLVAHEVCNKFYVCSGGTPVALKCPSNLLFNPSINACDWPSNVNCGNRTIPDNENEDNDICNCNPREAPSLCAREGSNGMLIAHENCSQYYMCVNGKIVEYSCPQKLVYNAPKQQCDWPIKVDCKNRMISHVSLNKHLEARQGVRV